MRLPRLLRTSRPSRRWLLPAAVLPLLFVGLSAGGPSANADGVIRPPWPGLPTVTVPDGWVRGLMVGSVGNGLSESARARQWIRIPAQAVAAEVENGQTRYPADDPEGRETSAPSSVMLFLSSPAGAKDGYGIGMPTTVHTVGFGSIPITVGLQLEQLRDADDLPVPLQLSFSWLTYKEPQLVRPGFSSQERYGSTLTGKVRVRLTTLSADGVDLGLGDCVSAPIDIDIAGETYWQGDPLLDPGAQGFVDASVEQSTWAAARGVGGVNGGGISGTIDIPAFSDCVTTSGDDISPLLTASVSGPGNPVTIGWGAVASSAVPLDHMCTTLIPGTPVRGLRGPFSGDPSDCDPAFGPPKLDYPARTD